MNVYLCCMRYLLIITLLTFGLSTANAQLSNAVKMPDLGLPWKSSELLEPAKLNEVINTGKFPQILNIGVVEDIKGARHIGPLKDEANLKNLKAVLVNVPRNTELVIYCGCCPFSKCPNIQPAYHLLKDMGYSHVEVLNLPVNLKTNWIARGYPVEKTEI